MKDENKAEYDEYIEKNGVLALYALQQMNGDTDTMRFGQGVYDTAQAYVDATYDTVTDGYDDRGRWGQTRDSGSLSRNDYFHGVWIENEPEHIASPLAQFLTAGSSVVAAGGAVTTVATCLESFGLGCIAGGAITGASGGLAALGATIADQDNPNWAPKCTSYAAGASDPRCRWDISLP